MGVSVEKLSLGQDAVSGQAVMQLRRFPLIGPVGMISRGPIWRSMPDVQALAHSLSGLGKPVLLNAEDAAPQDLCRAGFLNLMSETTIARLHLGPDLRAQMHQKWRNRLRKAETLPLRVKSVAFPPDPGHWLLQAEIKQRQIRKYRGWPPAFAVAFTKANRGQAKLFVAMSKRQPVAGMLFLKHGRMATYHLGHSTPMGRAMNAHTLLLAHAAEFLARTGIEVLDLGAIDTERAPGLARFKLGTGAQAHKLGGTWLYTRKLAPIARGLQAQLPSAAARISRMFAP